MNNEKNEEMLIPKNLWLGFIADVRKQGFAVLVLLGWGYFLHTDNVELRQQQNENRAYYQKKIESLEDKVDKCNEGTVKLYQEQHEKFIKVMEDVIIELKKL
jgi:hypothetical protein